MKQWQQELNDEFRNKLLHVQIYSIEPGDAPYEDTEVKIDLEVIEMNLHTTIEIREEDL